MVFILRNYKKFLQGTKESFRWVDLYIHRFDIDYNRLVKFDSLEEAQEFLDQHPELENEFDAWIQNTHPDHWK